MNLKLQALRLTSVAFCGRPSRLNHGRMHGFRTALLTQDHLHICSPRESPILFGLLVDSII
jgi:hypothetical protein